MSAELHLHEELMLLALRDREGTIASGTMYTHAVGGAVLAELLMSGRLAAEGEGRKTRIRVIDRTPLGDELLDEWLGTISEREKPRRLSDWVGRVAGTKDLKHRIALGLARRGILRTDEDKVLWIFTRKIYPEVDPGPERELKGRIEEAIFGEAQSVDPGTAVLIALAHHGGILKAVFDTKALKRHADDIERIISGERVGEATREAIQAMQAAVMAATIVPAVVASTSASASC